MADEEHDSDRIWDEYDWERFLQQQDRKTEKYMELLEKYLDHPNRDQIIAKEMGWSHLVESSGDEWAEADEAEFEETMDEDEDGEEDDDLEDDDDDEEEGEGESFEGHPLYQASFALTVWIDQLLEELGDAQNLPAAAKLAAHAAIASAKLAAALSDDDIDEIGMTIAYLKRALKAITVSMEAAIQLEKEAKLDLKRAGVLHHRLFQVRDGIICLMGEFRAEWRRRYGSR